MIHSLQIQLASPSTIKSWTERYLANLDMVGEILKADTINYRTFKPERGGLFCERIFGSITNGICSCGKTREKKMNLAPNATQSERNAFISAHQNARSVCSSCGVEPTDSRLRRYRMGYIELKKPIVHMWYFRNSPNIFVILLNEDFQNEWDISEFENLIHYHTYTPSTVKTSNYCLTMGYASWNSTAWSMLHLCLAGFFSSADEPAPWNPHEIRFPRVFKNIENTGAEALQQLLSSLDLVFMERQLASFLQIQLKRQRIAFQDMEPKRVEDYIEGGFKGRNKQIKDKSRAGQRFFGITYPVRILSKRLQYVRFLHRKQLRPEWTILLRFPVLPPDLRPMIQMSSGRFAASDLNDLYRRLIYRKQRMQKFFSLLDSDYFPDAMIHHELCLVQEASESIIDNGRVPKPAQRPNKMLLKSLTSIIEGKYGRFRQNLLGKRVDYSGRSVIVVGPKLRLHQCGLPREMALELFHPFLIRALLETGVVKNIRSAKNLIQKRTTIVWENLERVIAGHPVLLNRAPTLHHLGIQAFEPILLLGRAIQLHPLVCPAFNADFDGDQMAVHVPLSLYAQVEARLLMLATQNWLSPATGEPSITPSQDMILGFYYLTTLKPITKLKPSVKVLSSPTIMAQRVSMYPSLTAVMQNYALGNLHLHDIVWIRWMNGVEVSDPNPVQIQLSYSGHFRTIYDTYIVEQQPTQELYLLQSKSGRAYSQTIYSHATFNVNQTEQFSGIHCMNPPSLQGNMDSNELSTIYIRTTPGRVLFNHLLYENLFL